MPRFLIVILIIALGYYPVLYAFTWWTKDAVITQLVTAAKDGKLNTLEAHIDWDKLRKFLKRDLENKARSVREARSVPSFGPPPDKIASLVDHYITPKGIEMAFVIKDLRYPELSPRAFIADSGIEGPSSFSVTLALPEKIESQKGSILNKGERRFAHQFMRVRYVFERRGWRWRATEMHVPVFLVPPERHTMEQVKNKLNKAGPL